MAPRPSSPTISYLPAFVTVSICLAPAEFGWSPRTPKIRWDRLRPQAGYGPELQEPRVGHRHTVNGHASTDTRTPHSRQYLADFREVNATGVPLFRTGYSRWPIRTYGSYSLNLGNLHHSQRTAASD